MDKLFKQEVKCAKATFYQKAVAELKLKKPGQWYLCLKNITSYDQHNDQPVVDKISHLTDQQQAEIIA